MEFSFPWPLSHGEWLAWSSAAATMLIGLAFLLAPRSALRLLRVRTAPDHPELVALARATLAGFHLGLGLTCLLFAQPFLYMALGIAWTMTASGRLISILIDKGNTTHNWCMLCIESALAVLPLAFTFGLVA